MNSIIIRRVTDNGAREEKIIYELPDEDRYKYCLLGRATGMNMDHCVILGSKYKDDFWHRVYGYNVIPDGKEAKMMTEVMRKIKPETESYIAVRFYERFANRKIMYIPKRLAILNRPELNNFPLNIAFGTATLDDTNTERHETALYEPDLSTFTQNGDEQKMRYYNKMNPGRRFWAEIVYNIKDQLYTGAKYCGNTRAGSAFGKGWDMFFVHLTALGVGFDIDIANQ